MTFTLRAAGQRVQVRLQLLKGSTARKSDISKSAHGRPCSPIDWFPAREILCAPGEIPPSNQPLRHIHLNTDNGVIGNAIPRSPRGPCIHHLCREACYLQITRNENVIKNFGTILSSSFVRKPGNLPPPKSVRRLDLLLLHPPLHHLPQLFLLDPPLLLLRPLLDSLWQRSETCTCVSQPLVEKGRRELHVGICRHHHTYLTVFSRNVLPREGESAQRDLQDERSVRDASIRKIRCNKQYTTEQDSRPPITHPRFTNSTTTTVQNRSLTVCTRQGLIP